MCDGKMGEVAGMRLLSARANFLCGGFPLRGGADLAALTENSQRGPWVGRASLQRPTADD